MKRKNLNVLEKVKHKSPPIKNINIKNIYKTSNSHQQCHQISETGSREQNNEQSRRKLRA